MQEKEIKKIFKKMNIESGKKRECLLGSLTFNYSNNNLNKNKVRFTCGTKND